MRGRRFTAVVSATLGLVLLSGCGGDDEPAAGTTPVGSAAGPSDEPSDDSPATDLPSDLPTDVPTDLLSDLPTDAGDLGLEDDCEDIVQVLLDAAGAMGDMASDPTGAGAAIAGISQKLRDAAGEADDDSIASAAEDLAEAYDQLGASIANGEAPTDIDALTSASTALEEACT